MERSRALPVVDAAIALATIVLQFVARGVSEGVEGFGMVFEPWVGWTLVVATTLYMIALVLALPFYQRPQSSLVMGLSAASLLGLFGFLDLFLHYEWPVWIFIAVLSIVFIAIIAGSIFLGSKKAFDAIRVRLSVLHKHTPLLLTKRLYAGLSLPLLVIASGVASWAVESIVSSGSYGNIVGLLTVCLLFFILFIYATRQAVFPQEKVIVKEWIQRFVVLAIGIVVAVLL